MRKWIFYALFLIIFLSLPSPALAQEQCDLNVGPELPYPEAGQKVVCDHNWGGVVSVINNISGQLSNSVSCRSAEPSLTVLRVDVNSGTTDSMARAFANQINSQGNQQFPGGVKLVVLGVELNNLEWWGDTNQSLFDAGKQYAQEIFIPFAETIRADWPVAPAPPDLYNGVYDPVPWINGFLNGLGGRCDLVDALAADVFDVHTERVPYDRLDTWRYLEGRICSKKVIHFEGWGAWPGTESQAGASVKEQVEWYKTHPAPVTASTLIAPNCGSKKADGAEWWHYVCGKVYKADGTEVNPDSCGEIGEICDYNDGYKRSDPEFHSLRPYPHCPYEPAVSNVNYYMCGNDLIAKEKFTVTYDPASCGNPTTLADGRVECTYTFANRTIPVQVDLSETKFPIMGLTEGPEVTESLGVNNSQERAKSTMSDAQKTSEYVSWYLNGTTNRAEGNLLKVLPNYPAGREQFPEGYADTRKLIDFSGPLKKLLPLRIQNDKREEQIANAGASEVGYLGERARHDQIAACYYQMNSPLGGLGILGQAASWLTDVLEIDEVLDLAGFQDLAKKFGDGSFIDTVEKIPGPCYPENEDQAKISLGILGSISLVEIEKVRLTDWLVDRGYKLKDSTTLPPKREDYPSFQEYWKAYRRWRGEICSLSFLGFYLCFDEKDIGIPELIRPNLWGQLFSYIPFSSTEDRIGYAEADLGATSQPGGSVVIDNIAFTPSDGGDGKLKYLYFPHMQETSELGKLLQSTYVPAGKNNFDGGETRGIYDTSRCEPVESRTNPGDRLYGNETMAGDETEMIKGDITYSGTYKCQFGKNESGNFSGTCEQETAAALSIYTAVPKVEEVWDRYVNGAMSIFKRIYPKIGIGAPVEKIEDIPAEGEANYSATNAEVLAGDPNKQRPGSNAKVYFPHVGSVYDYFLKGIQKALRPHALSSPVTTIGNPPGGPITDSQILASIACPTSNPGPGSYPPGVFCEIPESVCSTTLDEIPSKYRGDFYKNARYWAATWVGESPEKTTNHFDQCYAEVVQRSLAAGVNPLYTLAFWIQESGASNYERFYCDPNDENDQDLQDFGFNDPTIAGNFEAQISKFLQLPFSYPHDYPQCFSDGCNVGNFSLVFQQGPSAQCIVNDDAKAYAEKTIRTMALLAPNCTIKYPTDMSCP